MNFRWCAHLIPTEVTALRVMYRPISVLAQCQTYSYLRIVVSLQPTLLRNGFLEYTSVQWMGSWTWNFIISPQQENIKHTRTSTTANDKRMHRRKVCNFSRHYYHTVNQEQILINCVIIQQHGAQYIQLLIRIQCIDTIIWYHIYIARNVANCSTWSLLFIRIMDNVHLHSRFTQHLPFVANKSEK
jgi:hypothetical protein